MLNNFNKNGQIEMDNMYPSSNSIDAKYGVSYTCSALGEIGLSCVMMDTHHSLYRCST